MTRLVAVTMMLLGVAFLLGGIGTFAAAKGAIHEIAGLVMVLISATLFGFGFLLNSTATIIKTLNEIRDHVGP